MAGIADYKRDTRPPRKGWAPGQYLNKCCTCGSQMLSDKRAVLCADCAYKEAVPTPDRRVSDERRAEHEALYFTIVEHNKDERLTEKTLRFINDLLADSDDDFKRIVELEAQLSDARANALEEAAKVVEEASHDTNDSIAAATCRAVALIIRDLRPPKGTR